MLLATGAQARSSSGRMAVDCTGGAASPAYVARVERVLRSGRDLWGEELLAARGGPTYAAARRFLSPLLLARGPHGRSLTTTGTYYLPFAQPAGAAGAASVALHVADGSEIIARRVGGRSVGVFVGAGGREQFGACVGRRGAPALAEGWLPILETSYRDAGGARYRQESFAALDPETQAPVSYLRVSAVARRAVQVRLRAGRRLTFAVPGGTLRTVYAAWSPSRGSLRTLGAEAYARAREGIVAYWRERLTEGATISVPEPRVEDATRALLVQDLVLTWRYSIGNPYEELSFPEGPDVARVLAEQGFGDVSAAILRESLQRPSTGYPNWKHGERLLASAELVRLFDDRGYLAQAGATLRGFAAALERQISSSRTGLLPPERYSSDIGYSVYGLHTQTVVWQALREMGDVWAANGEPALAARCRRAAARLERGLRRAVALSERRLPDGSLFLPVRMLDGERPYENVTQERLGSYWNLVVPYALASGLFPPGGIRARGALRYLLLHGSRLLGLVRAGAYALYGRNAAFPLSGTDEVYGINVARFLADNEQADQLVLSLYGQLGAGMTDGTFVSGEAASVSPVDGGRLRAMYLPPNGASNAAFLETLRLMLVHETRDTAGRPHGLQLAYASPRAWLQPGKRIAVANVPTSFGPVSYTLEAGTSSVRASVAVPTRARLRTLSLRLRVPRGARISSVSLGGRPYGRFDRTSGTIDLSGRSGSLQLVATLARSGAAPKY